MTNSKEKYQHQAKRQKTKSQIQDNEKYDSNRSGVPRNPNLEKLKAGYLFPKIAKLRNEHKEANPDAKLISLGIGDTTQPIPKYVSEAMQQFSHGLSTSEGYSGYGSESGRDDLRKSIAKVIYQQKVDYEDVFVSDGSKCDISRLQTLFGQKCTVSVQNPSYPVYVDTSIIFGLDQGLAYEGIQYLDCTPENEFFPDLSKAQRTDIIYFCSPNNPTGASATRKQLEKLVKFALDNRSIIVYDAAYAPFISDPNVPKSIFDIEGAKQCAIETTSFSKYAGFTGVRLGWTVVPSELKYADGFQVRQDFNRIMSTCFNGASNIAQAGGLACLKTEGLHGIQDLIKYYMENAQLLIKCFTNMGFKVYGGKDAPYIWVHFPGQDSWAVFQDILKKCDIVTTPGQGFGSAGQGFIRVSAFGSREQVKEACERFRKAYQKN